MCMWRILECNCECYPRSFAHFELLLGSGGGFGRSIGSNLCGFSGFLCFPSYESGESSVENEYKKTPFLNFKFRFLPAFAFLLLGYFFIGKGWRRICDDNRAGFGLGILRSGCCCIWFTMWLLFYAG